MEGGNMQYSKEILNLVGITLQEIKEKGGEKRKKFAIKTFTKRIEQLGEKIETLKEERIVGKRNLQNYFKLCQTGTAIQLQIIIEKISYNIQNLIEERILYSDSLYYLQEKK